jgi:hypothetical protein
MSVVGYEASQLGKGPQHVSLLVAEPEGLVKIEWRRSHGRTTSACVIDIYRGPIVALNNYIV